MHKFSSRLTKKIKNQTHAEYLNHLKTIPESNYKWITDIIDGTDRSDIIYEDDCFVLVPPRKWKDHDPTKLHILAFPKDTRIKSMRSLNGSHIDLLEHIHNTTLGIIEKIYGVNREDLRAYVHYPPTIWLLHIHYNLIINPSSCGVEYSYTLQSIIKNLKLKSDYYEDDMEVAI